MPLNAVNFITKGPVLHADLLQFYNLFTGVMLDQPVTFKNVLTLGGNQGASTVPLKIYGAVGQTGHLLDLYTDTNQAQPGFGFGAAGNFGWGPGGASPVDTFLSRVATQNGHATDTAGLLIQPYLEVAGPIQGTSFQFSNGTALSSTSPLQLTINQDLIVNRDVQAGRNVTAIGNLVLNTAGAGLQVRDAPSNSLATVLVSNGGYMDMRLANASYAWRVLNQAGTAMCIQTDNSGAFTSAASVNATTYLSAGTYIILPQSQRVEWGDANSAIWSNARVTYFDEYAGGWYWRNSASGFATTFAMDGSGNAWHYGSLMVIDQSAISHTAQLHVAGSSANFQNWSFGNTSATVLNLQKALIMVTDTYSGGGCGGGIIFGVGGCVMLAGIRVAFIDGTANGRGNLSFATRRNNTDASLTESFMISSDGTCYARGVLYTGAILGVNLNRTANSGQVQLLANTSAGDGAVYCTDNGNMMLWLGSGAVNVQGNGGGSGWRTINALSFAVQSALKDKRNVATLEGALDLVQNSGMRAVRYNESYTGNPMVGFVADEWLNVVPEVVHFDDDGEVLSMDYSRVGAITFEALKEYIQKTDARIAELEARLAA